MRDVVKWISANSTWVALWVSIMAAIVVSEVSECADLICKWIIICATKVLGWMTTPEIGRDRREKWLSHIPEMPGRFAKIVLTIGMLARAVPRTCWILAWENIPANLARAMRRRLTGWWHASNSPKPGVELARLDRDHIALRRRGSGVLIVDYTEFKAFLKQAKKGEYDFNSLPLAG